MLPGAIYSLTQSIQGWTPDSHTLCLLRATEAELGDAGYFGICTLPPALKDPSSLCDSAVASLPPGIVATLSERPWRRCCGENTLKGSCELFAMGGDGLNFHSEDLERREHCLLGVSCA